MSLRDLLYHDHCRVALSRKTTLLLFLGCAKMKSTLKIIYSSNGGHVWLAVMNKTVPVRRLIVSATENAANVSIFIEKKIILSIAKEALPKIANRYPNKTLQFNWAVGSY